MCPACMTAVVIAGSVASTGALAALAMKKLGVTKAADNRLPRELNPKIGKDM